jgi:hypothetical protein
MALRWYLAGTVISMALFFVLVIIVAAFPRATPVVFALLISSSVVLAYVWWRMNHPDA